MANTSFEATLARLTRESIKESLAEIDRAFDALFADRDERQSRQEGQRAETAWLIEFPERGDSYRDGKRVGPAEPRKYYRGGKRRTEDHAEAVRFARKVDAEAVLTELDNDTVFKLGVTTGGFVCEHMWIGDAAITEAAP